MTTGEIVAVIGTIYICIGLLISTVIHTIVNKSGKEYDDGILVAIMFLSVLFWPIFFYWVFKGMKD